MAHTGGYRRSAVWRRCGGTPHAALQNKSVVCSGSRVTISTVMKLHWSVKRGGIIVKTYTKSTCSHLQFKRSDFLAAPHHAHLCSEHFSECDFANPMEYRYSFKILPGRLKLIRLYPCGSLGDSISFVFGARIGHFAATPQSDAVGIWSRDLGVVATLSVRQKMPFFVHL